MKTLTLKEFITALNARIDRYTHEELKEIILAQGMALAPRERALFLDKFVLQEKKKGKAQVGKKDRNEAEGFLLKEIESFGRRVEEYEFTDGWGWDSRYGDERAWGDDSWAAEIDDLFDRVCTIYKNGNHQTARKAFESLLDIYREGQEEGKLSGYDHDEMIETNIGEAKLKYLRCVYLTETSPDRPQAIWSALSRFTDDASDLNIHGMIHVDMEELPQLEDFGQRWPEFLKKQEVSSLSAALVREAVRLFQGIRGLETLAAEDGLKYPGAFLEWLEALRATDKYDEMVRAASLGLERLPAGLWIRSKIADYLHEAAIRLNKKALIGRSLKEALMADPCLERLLNALDYAENREERKKILDENLAFIEVNDKKQSRERTWQYDRQPDFFEKEVPGDLGLQCRLLSGNYEMAAAAMEKSKPLGWSSGEDPGVLGVPFFLVAKWNPERRLTANLAELWNEATDPLTLTDYDIEGDVAEDRPGRRQPEKTAPRFRKYLEAVLKEMPLRAADKERYSVLAEKIACNRIVAIVGNKRRKSYWKAAELLLAVAEVYWSNDRRNDGQALIDRVKDKYRRHSAFRDELRTRARKSGIFTV
ncbi:MAG TPA: hypothetical protein DIW61_05605 [Candidatus Aminicenantes bacterium]|nr:hypothetical protein [Candidatus Aminicenantes bacterium]